jgi:hypothetical protein
MLSLRDESCHSGKRAEPKYPERHEIHWFSWVKVETRLRSYPKSYSTFCWAPRPSTKIYTEWACGTAGKFTPIAVSTLASSCTTAFPRIISLQDSYGSTAATATPFSHTPVGASVVVATIASARRIACAHLASPSLRTCTSTPTYTLACPPSPLLGQPRKPAATACSCAAHSLQSSDCRARAWGFADNTD